MHSQRCPANRGRYGGAVAELWKAVVGQRAQASLSACAQSITGAWTVTAATGRVPQEDNGAEIASLPNTLEEQLNGEQLRCSVTLAR